ncbi:MAG TPA: helix-turn-helix domain-containing protein [Methylophilaceae bacterium]|nr:helix-turn-helix domain-containing protein [Methylophilaceae bacterium]
MLPELREHAGSVLQARFSSQSTRDFEQQASLLHGWNQGYAQLSSGAFEGFVTEMQFADLHLFLEYTGQRLFQNGKLPDDVIAIGVPLALSSSGMFCGTAFSSPSLHIFSGKAGFEFYSPTGLVMGGIAVKRDALMASLTADEQASLAQRCNQAHLLQLDKQGLQAIQQLMSEAFDMVRNNPSLIENKAVRASLRKSVFALVSQSLIEHENGSEPVSTEKCWKIIAEARQLIHERTDSAADSPLTVAELCLHLGVSRRTLQNCFQNVLDTSPVAYLRAERLNGVRHMMKSAQSVTEAATHWGFWHFGHFSQEYKKMFGELPSATFRRVRGFN